MNKNFLNTQNQNKYLFRIDEITDNFFLSDAKDIKTAKELFENNRVSITSAVLTTDSNSENYLDLEVTITDFDNSVHTVNLTTAERKLIKLYCSSEDHHHTKYEHTSFYRNPCVYELAALTALKDYIVKYNPGDTTDSSAAKFINTINYIDKPKNQKTENNIILQMNIYYSAAIGLKYYSHEEIFTVTFKIGTAKKMYILRNIEELIEVYHNQGKFRLSKNFEIDFLYSDFNEESMITINALQQYYAECKKINNKLKKLYIYERYKNSSKSSIVFDDTNFDRLYDMINNRTLINDLPVKKTEENIKLSMTLNAAYYKTSEEFNGINVKVSLPELFSGTDNYYTINKKYDKYIFNKISYNQSALIKGLQETDNFSNPQTTKEFHIGRQRISEFINDTIPKIENLIDIKHSDIEKLSTFLPPAPEFHFYLDAADGIPACYPRVVYDGTEFDFTDHLKNLGIAETIRDVKKELAALTAAKEYFNIADTDNRRIICNPDDSESIYNFLSEGVEKLSKYGQVHATNSFDSIKIKNNYNFSIGVSIENDLLNLEITSSDFSPLELLDIIKSYQKKKKYHLLKNGEFVSIDDKIKELYLMMNSMNITAKEFTRGKMQIPAYRALYLDKMLEECHEIHANRNIFYKKLIRSFKTVSDSDFDVPDELNNIMREYQKYGYSWLRTLESYGFGGILADDMGLGKTLQVISVLYASKKEGKNGLSLIICPASLIYNWFEEFKKFAPEINVLTVSGTAANRAELISKSNEYDVIVTSYDLLKRDIAAYENISFLYQIIDEAQYIKNYSTAAAKSVKLIQSKYKFALTGTPIENRLSELWSIFDFLMPGFLYGYDKFKNEIEIPVVRLNDNDAASRLKRLVSPFILRRMKKDVLKDLPDKIEETHFTKFEPEQQKIYDGQVLKFQQMLNSEDEEDFKKKKILILAELTKIRQICCDPSLVFENYSEISAKREACLELVTSAVEGKHRILIFSQFTSMLDLIARDLKNNGLDFFTITGSTPKEKRTELVNEFNNGNTPVFLISLKAGGTGLNLTGADVVIHLDPWWNIAAQNQATDRAHRIGQKNTVTVYKLIIKNTIEEKIQQMQEKKKELANSILDGESASISSLTREELLELFK